MPKVSTKKKAPDSDDSSDTSIEDKNPPAKKSKPNSSQKSGTSSEPSWDLAPNKVLKIREFKGKIYIDIREYYNDGSDMKPTRKGISLNTTMWQKLKGIIEEVDGELKKM